MPIDNDNKLKDILKTIVSFNINTDLDDDEAKKEFINYFIGFINSNSELKKPILSELLKSINNILNNMNIIQKKSTTNVDDDNKNDMESIDVPSVDALSDVHSENFSKLLCNRANDFLM